MRKYLVFFIYSTGIISCKLGSGSDGPAAEYAGARSYQLGLNPPVGSKSLTMVLPAGRITISKPDDKKIENLSKVDASVIYAFDKDSAGDFVIRIQYNKVHVYSKNGDDESDLDAANAANSGDPVEGAPGRIADGQYRCGLNHPHGARYEAYRASRTCITGMYHNRRPPIPFQLNTVKERWNHTVGDELVNKNMEQLFRIFPDSAVHIGDKWQQAPSGQKGELGLKPTNTFTLTDIRDHTAFIESPGTITSDSTATQFMGYNVTTDLKGKQTGEYQVDTKTGMLLSATINVNVEGTLQAMGREIPLTIENEVKIKRQ